MRKRRSRWVWAHVPQLAAGLAAAIPVIDSTVKAVHAGWTPAGDDGIIATRGWDVLSSHTPLVGQYSEAGLVIHGQVMHSPGPMLYWLIALPARYGSVSSIAVTMGVLNTLAIVGCVTLARRRGGLVLMFAAAAGIALMCQSLPGEAMHDIWNPAAGLFPFLALIFVSWSLACGEYRLLPIGALIASYVVQTHLMYAAPTAVLVAVGCGGLLVWRATQLMGGRRRRADVSTDTAPDAAHADPSAASIAPDTQAAPPARRSGTPQLEPRRIWPWALAALLIAAACWTAPAIDQVENNPGNLTMIVRTAEHRGKTLGASVGWHAVARSVGWRPWWLYVPASEWERKADVRAPPSTTRTNSTIAILAALALAGLIGGLARRLDLTAASLIGLGLCAAIWLEAASNPARQLLAETLGYTMWWGSELGLWVWLILAWALWLGLAGVAGLAHARLRALVSTPSPPNPPAGSRPAAPAPAPCSPHTATVTAPHAAPHAPPHAPRPVSPSAEPTTRTRPTAVALASLAALVGVLAVGNGVAKTIKPDSHSYEYRSIHAIAAALARAVPPGQTIEYRFGPLDTGTQPMEPAIRYLLVRHGDRVLARGSFTRLGSYYEYYGQPVDWIVFVRDGLHRPQPHMRLVGVVRFHSPWGREVLSAWVSRGRRSGSAGAGS